MFGRPSSPPLITPGSHPTREKRFYSGRLRSVIIFCQGFATPDAAGSSDQLDDVPTAARAATPSFLLLRLPILILRCPPSNYRGLSSVEVCEPPASGAMDVAWTWRELPAMSAARNGCGGCVMSDGCFAVLGETDATCEPFSSCEALVVGHDEHWEVLPLMHEAKSFIFACAAVAECIIVAGGYGRTPNGMGHLRLGEVFYEVLGRWLQLPCDLPYKGGLRAMGSALL